MDKNYSTLYNALIDRCVIYIKKDWCLSLEKNESYIYEISINDRNISTLEAQDILKALLSLNKIPSLKRMKLLLQLRNKYPLSWKLSEESKEEIKNIKIPKPRHFMQDGKPI